MLCMYIESDLVYMLIVKDSYRKLWFVRNCRQVTQAQWRAPGGIRTVQTEGPKVDDSWSLGSSFIIWRFARVAALLPRLPLHRMAPTNAIPHNSSGTGNVCVVSAVSLSPLNVHTCCTLGCPPAGDWITCVSVGCYGYWLFRVSWADCVLSVTRRGDCESSASGGTFDDLNWLGDRRSLLLGSGMFSHAGSMLHEQSFHGAATVSAEDTTQPHESGLPK